MKPPLPRWRFGLDVLAGVRTVEAVPKRRWLKSIWGLAGARPDASPSEGGTSNGGTRPAIAGIITDFRRKKQFQFVRREGIKAELFIVTFCVGTLRIHEKSDSDPRLQAFFREFSRVSVPKKA